MEIIKATTIITDLNENYKLVPWLNWEEWDFVRLSLFSTSPCSVSKALSRIATWRSRGCLPVVVEVTASFVEIQWKDPYFSGKLSNEVIDSEEMLAMLYTMAVLRLVNVIIEKTREREKLSIADAADIIDMPRMLIDIRHEGSHRELPSLPLLRQASIKAINWLKSYYWDPQKNAVPYQSGESANVRKEIRSRLRELAFSLKLKHSGSRSSEVKGKRAKHHEHCVGATVGRNKLFSLVASKIQPSKYVGSKKQIARALKKLVRLYSFFSSDVISVFLDFLLKTSNSTDFVDSPHKYQINLSLDVAQHVFEEWRPVITKLSKTDPELLLSLLKAVLDMIGSRKSIRDDFGSENFSLSQYDSETQIIGVLSTLFKWLVLVLKDLKTIPHEGEGSQPESPCCLPRTALIELVRRGLLLADTENHDLLGSALLLAKMGGNNYMNEKIRKLSLLTSLYSRHSEGDSHLKAEDLTHQDKYIRQAAEKLEMVKLRKISNARLLTGGDNVGNKNIWTIAKSWNPCPIGMLPRAVGSSGYLPFLDHGTDHESYAALNFIDNEENQEPKHCNKREATCDIETIDDSRVKKMKDTQHIDLFEPDDTDEVSTSDGIKGRLLIDGVLQKVGDQVQQEIQSRLRILIVNKRQS